MNSSHVPFFDLTAQNRSMSSALNAAWRSSLKKTDYILGPAVAQFEKNFASYLGCRYAVGVSSGLDALALALRALGVGPGHEVIVPAHTFIATALAVSMVGARPVLVDVDDEALLMDAEKFKKAVTRRTRAVIPVHLYGQPFDVSLIQSFCRRRGIAIVEDAAQAHGARLGRQKCGALADAGCFSFYPSKNLGAFGDGGMVSTSHEELWKKLRLLRNYGSNVKYLHEIEGGNHRLDTLQAAVLDQKLRRLDDWNRRRRTLAARYDRLLSNIPGLRRLPKRTGTLPVYHLYVIRLAQRDALKSHLDQKGIGTGIHYPIAIHRQKAYAGLGYRAGDFPVAEKAAAEVLSLPMYPEMPLAHVDRVCAAIRSFWVSERSA